METEGYDEEISAAVRFIVRTEHYVVYTDGPGMPEGAGLDLRLCLSCRAQPSPLHVAGIQVGKICV